MKPRISLAVVALSFSPILFPAAHATTSETVHDYTTQASPRLLDKKDRQQYRAIFDAIQASDWAKASELIARSDKGPMRWMATAELYLAAGSPRVEANELETLLNAAPWLPQAEQLEKLAIKRGAVNLPQRPGTRSFSWLGEAPRRSVPDSIADPSADSLRREILNFIKNDSPAEAEAALNNRIGSLGSDARTELQHRVAWSYYIENDDVNAQRMGALARSGSGVWAFQGAWAYALASWRLGHFESAFDGFDQVARSADNDDMRAAGLFWSARAATASRQPQLAQSRLQNAAQMPETFYGLLASEALGMEPIARKQIRAARLNWDKLKRAENAQLAVGLAEIGESRLADEAIKYQARIGDARNHGDLANLAGALNLPTTQLWLGHYGPSRDSADAMSRYPMPSWQPTGGWRVDPALAFAHTLQESQFRSSVVSPANAVGLMQVRPGTAGDIARSKGVSFQTSDLKDPRVNLEYGQSYLEYLRDASFTGGLLPKVIAAYNAGPAPVTRWNNEIRDNGDPLLYIESVPYWETRGYLTIILRNYWIYEMRAGKSGGSMAGLAQYLWPRFPGSDGVSVAVNGNGNNLGN